jgi:hypothetical protein
MQLHSPFNTGIAPNQPLPGRAAVFVGFRIINEIVLAKPSLCRGVGGDCFWYDGANPGLVAIQDLSTLEIAAVGNNCQIVCTYCCAGLFCHVGQLVPIRPDVGHFMCHNQVVLGIHRRLDVVTDNAFAPCLHGTGIGVGEGDLFIRRCIELNFIVICSFKAAILS